MILKIERYEQGQDWWMLDDIKKIGKSKPFITDPIKDYDAATVDVVILDYSVLLAAENGSTNSAESIRLICRLSNGEELSIIFDTVAYILNDNGKTIEKLVANYR